MSPRYDQPPRTLGPFSLQSVPKGAVIGLLAVAVLAGAGAVWMRGVRGNLTAARTTVGGGPNGAANGAGAGSSPALGADGRSPVLPGAGAEAPAGAGLHPASSVTGSASDGSTASAASAVSEHGSGAAGGMRAGEGGTPLPSGAGGSSRLAGAQTPPHGSLPSPDGAPAAPTTDAARGGATTPPSADPSRSPIVTRMTPPEPARPALPPASDGSRGASPPGATGTDAGAAPPTGSERDSDRVPPVLDQITFEPGRVEDGQESHLVIRIHDDLSGVRSVTGSIRSPSGRALFSFEATPTDETATVFAANFRVPAKAETGTWYVTYIYAPDRADNPFIASYTPATAPNGATLLVMSSEGDATPPTIGEIVLSSPSVPGGEHNHLRVDVQDDGSGVASVVGSFQSPSGAALIPFICRLNPDSNAWEGDVIVPQHADCGQWIVHQVLAVDKAGNSAVLQAPNPQIANVGFNVVSEGCDATAPTLDALSLSPTTVSNEVAAEVVITASVSDAGSGATSMTGWASGPASTTGVPPKLLFACVPANPNDPSAGWTGKIMVPQFAAKGLWRVSRVRVQDRAQNVRDYTSTDAILSGATFTVQ